MIANIDQFWCKHCNTYWQARIPLGYTGDAFVECPECRCKHSRQFEAGVAVSCNAPTSRPITIPAIRGIDVGGEGQAEPSG